MSCCGGSALHRPHFAASGECKSGADLASIVIHIPLRKDDMRDESQQEFQQLIVGPCIRAGLHVRAFYGVPGLDGSKSIYLQVSAPNERLLLEAERLKMTLELDPHNLAEADVAENQRLVNEQGMTFDVKGADSEHVDLHIPPANIGWCSCFVNAEANDPYVRIFAPYVPDPKLRGLYALQSSTNFVLSEVHALKLLLSIMEARPETEHGAGLNLDHLQVKKKIQRWFPGHSVAGRARLRDAWLGVRMPWNVPVGRVREYLGERVAFYFAFLGHAARWMVLPSLVGLGIFAHQVVSKGPNTVYLPIYGVLVAVWSTIFWEYWKREQSKLEQKWGMTGYSKHEPLRPEYTSKAKRVRSFVDGKPTYFYDETAGRVKKTLSGSLTLTLLGAVVVIVGSIFWVRVLLVKQDNAHGGKIPDGYPDYITSVINAVVIQLMNFVFSTLARVLSNWENHPTKSSYDNSLTLKLAVFNGINSYFPLMYIAAIKNSITIAGERQQCKLNSLGQPDCMAELQSQLAILILTKFALSVGITFLLPLFWRAAARCCLRFRYRGTPEKVEAYDAWTAARKASSYEREAGLPPYDPFDDYLEVMLLFGYATLFVVAFPLAPLIVFFAIVVNVYVDRDRIMRLTSRPMPEGAQSIGSWGYVFEALCYLSTITNLTVVVFTNTGPIFGQDYDYYQRLVFFIVAEHIILIMKFVISSYIPDRTYHTSLQLLRQDYLVSKHILGVKDLVISRREAEAADVVSNADGPSSPGGGAGASAGDDAARFRVRVAKSWFSLTGQSDPRVSAPGIAAMGGGGDPRASGVVSRMSTHLHGGSPAEGMTLVPVATSASTVTSPMAAAVAANAARAVPVPLASAAEGGGVYPAYGGGPVAYAAQYGSMPVPGGGAGYGHTSV